MHTKMKTQTGAELSAPVYGNSQTIVYSILVLDKQKLLWLLFQAILSQVYHLSIEPEMLEACSDLFSFRKI